MAALWPGAHARRPCGFRRGGRRCQTLERELREERGERREVSAENRSLNAENRRLLEDNGRLREEIARLRLSRPGVPLGSSPAYGE